MKFSVNVSVKLLKTIGIFAAVGLLAWGIRFGVGFRNDYIRIHNDNEIMWQYFTQGVKLKDGTVSTRAVLLNDLLVERDK